MRSTEELPRVGGKFLFDLLAFGDCGALPLLRHNNGYHHDYYQNDQSSIKADNVRNTTMPGVM